MQNQGKILRYQTSLRKIILHIKFYLLSLTHNKISNKVFNHLSLTMQRYQLKNAKLQSKKDSNQQMKQRKKYYSYSFNKKLGFQRHQEAYKNRFKPRLILQSLKIMSSKYSLSLNRILTKMCILLILHTMKKNKEGNLLSQDKE